MIERYCDLHCDTLFEIRKNNSSLIKNDHHISLEKLAGFRSFIQVMAMWSDKRLDADEAYNAFLDASDIFEREVYNAQENGYNVAKAVTANDIIANENGGISSLVLAVEGGVLVNRDLSRLETIRNKGARLLTLVWAGENQLGGAHDCDTGLTDFGKSVVKECFELGITLDISHAGDRMIYEVFELAEKHGKAVVATHSNSRFVHTHTRNLTDEYFKELIRLRGVAGISLAPEHLAVKNVSISDVIRHMSHYFEMSANGVCLGCDFDGITSVPNGIKDVTSLDALSDALAQRGFAADDINNIMYNNARNFLVANL